MNAIRGDAVNAGLLGIGTIVSDDVVRHALNHLLDEKAALDWLAKHQRLGLETMLTLPWILDIDSTVKPLYGKQQGAEVGYNPHKPGRSSLLPEASGPEWKSAASGAVRSPCS